MDISSLRERTGGSVMSVCELNNYIRSMFDSSRLLSSVSVVGEISNFTNHRSGHLYFSLKDSEGQIRAVMFRSSAMGLRFMPENGMRVIVHGSVSVYTRDGSYQIYVNSMQPDGVGALYLAYEQLKARLEKEGLFSAEHKKPIPRFPQKVGVITSPTGAAVRDIINIVTRRYPLAKIYVYPALVQGDMAEDSLVLALDYLDKSGLVDVVIIGRGGGSIEDLWAFNGEKLARRIFEADVPVISAVGHETDFTICDFVADLRAPTPSAAAELAVPDGRELIQRIDSATERCEAALRSILKRKSEKLGYIKKNELFTNPRVIFKGFALKKKTIAGAIDAAYERAVMMSRGSLSVLSGKLNALSPLAVLSRGYSITQVMGKVVSSAYDVNVGDIARVEFADGSFDATVNSISRKLGG